MSARNYLLDTGILLLLLGALGWVGLMGPTAGNSALGSIWWFDATEIWAYFAFGLVGVIASLLLPAPLHRIIAIVFGIMGIVLALYSLFPNAVFMGASLERPVDTIFYLVLGAWGLSSAAARYNTVVVARRDVVV